MCVEGAFNTTQEQQLLASYDDDTVTYGRLQVFKLLACTLNAFWGALQKSTNVCSSLDAWRHERLVTATQLADDSQWTMWLAELK